MAEMSHCQRVHYSRANAMESHLPDMVGDILELLHLSLLARVHHPDDCVDGRGECVELLLKPCNQQNKRHDQQNELITQE